MHRAPKGSWEIIIIPPKPKTFFERTFPHATPAWPSNKLDRRGKTPLLVV